MSLVSKAMQSLVEKGVIGHKFSIDGVKFEMEVLSTEEQILSDGLVDIESLKEKYNTEKKLSTYPDMIGKYRSMAQIAFAVRKVNGENTVDRSLPEAEQFKQLLEFRDELSKLSAGMLDQLIKEYRVLGTKERDFYKDFEGNVGKS